MTPAGNFSLGIALLAHRRGRALLVGFVEVGLLGESAEIVQEGSPPPIPTAGGIEPSLAGLHRLADLNPPPVLEREFGFGRQ